MRHHPGNLPANHTGVGGWVAVSAPCKAVKVASAAGAARAGAQLVHALLKAAPPLRASTHVGVCATVVRFNAGKFAYYQLCTGISGGWIVAGTTRKAAKVASVGAAPPGVACPPNCFTRT